MSSDASADDLVTNGGFETGTIAGWTQIGNYATVYNAIANNGHTGLYAYEDGNFPSSGYAGLSQQLATVAGASYDISLWWTATGNNGAAGQGYQVLWNSVVIGEIQGASASTTYTNLLYHVVAIGNDTLAFQGFSSNGYNLTDDVSVVAGVPAAAVPEPATWGLMIVGFGMMGGAVRHRRRSTNVAFA